MLAAQNPKYMCIYLENLRLSASLETLKYAFFICQTTNHMSHPYRKAYQTLVSNASTSTPSDAMADTVQLDHKKHPQITYWFKHLREEERRRQEEFKTGKGRRGPAQAAKGKNVAFWFLKEEDGTMLDGFTMANIRFEAKGIWREMCNKHGPIGLPWTSVLPKYRQLYWQKIEALFPILWFCDAHYKADSIAISDYTHWYKSRYPDGSPKEGTCKCSCSPSPTLT